MIIIFSFLIIGLNYFFLKVAGLNLIFLLMRVQSLYFYGFNKRDTWTKISYLIFIPEMITGPHREFSAWRKPSIKLEKLLSVDTFLVFFIYLNLILGSGYFYKILTDYSNNFFYQHILVTYTLFIQFWSASRIVNIISEIFGEDFVKNFNNPFIAKSFSDFWPRWHVSLSNFAKKYISQPVNYLSLKRGYQVLPSYFIAILVSFLFIGIWHKISASFILFSLLASIILIAEKIFLEKYKKKISSKLLGKLSLMFYTQLAFLISILPLTNDLRNILIKP